MLTNIATQCVTSMLHVSDKDDCSYRDQDEYKGCVVLC